MEVSSTRHQGRVRQSCVYFGLSTWKHSSPEQLYLGSSAVDRIKPVLLMSQEPEFFGTFFSKAREQVKILV